MRVRKPALLAAFLILALLLGGLAACASSQSPAASGPDLLATAAAEATAIVQRAEATALVLQAQAQAEARIAQANDPLGPRAKEEPVKRATLPTQATTKTDSVYPPPTREPGTPEATAEQTVQVTGVGFAGEGGFIIIRFKAPPKEAERWWQGSISVTDEGTGAEFNEIPEMPKIGPLISKPKVYGQVGYAMLVNKPPGLPSGALVTVILGNHRFEHVRVE